MKVYHLILGSLLAVASMVACSKKESKSEDLKASFGQVVPTAGDLPECTTDLTSHIFWVEAESKFVICNGTGFADFKGQQGPTGDKGNDGTTGATGETGPAGSEANSGVWLYDGNDKLIGLVIDTSKPLVLLENGGLMRINLKTGAYLSAVAISETGSLSDETAQCYTTAADCNSACYQLEYNGNIHLNPIKGSIYNKRGVFYMATGREILGSNIPLQGRDNPGGICDDLGAPQVGDAYPITTLYSLPEGISFPLTLPLYLGKKNP